MNEVKTRTRRRTELTIERRRRKHGAGSDPILVASTTGPGRNSFLGKAGGFNCAQGKGGN